MAIRKELRQQPAKKMHTPQPETVTFKPDAWYNKSRLQFWGIVLFSALLYIQTLGYDYALDDSLMITANQFTKMGTAGLDEIMSNDAFTGFFGVQKKLVAGGRYRPLSQIMFALEYQFFGLNPMAGHLINVLLYAFTGGLLFLFLRRLLKDVNSPWYHSVPLIAALLFAAHPLHTEVVANIKGRDEILTWLLSLSGLYLTLYFTDTKKWGALAGIFVLSFLAILAKENAITMLAVVPLMLYFFRKASVKTHLIVIAPMLIALLPYFYLRYEALGYLTSSEKITEILNDPYVNASVAEKLATNIYTWGLYLKLLIFPHPLTHDYYPMQIPIINWGDFRALLSLLLYIGMGAVSIMLLRKRSLVSFGILFFFITFSISSNVVFNIGTFMNERFMFVPLLGFTVVVAFLLKRYAGAAAAKYILLVLVLMYSVKTISRNPAWENDYILFTTDVKTSTNSAKVNVSAGGKSYEKSLTSKNESEKEQLLTDAERYIRRGLELYPNYSAGWVLLGNVFLERKDYTNAAQFYANCLQINPKQGEALKKYAYAGVQLGLKDKYSQAEVVFRHLMKLEPENDEHLIHLADQLSRLDRKDTALIMMQNLIAKRPDYGDAWSKIGEIYGRAFNDLKKSEEALLKAYQLDAKNPSTLENLGIVYGFTNRFSSSVEFFRKALAIDTANTRMMQNLSNTYRLMGNTKAADSLLQKAAALAQSGK